MVMDPRVPPSAPTGDGQLIPDAPDHRVGMRLLQWLWRRGFRFLFVLDALALFGMMVVFNLIRFGSDWPTYPLSHYLMGFTIATAVHLIINYFAGLYQREPRLGHRSWMPRVAVATAVAVSIDAIAALLTERYLMPRLNLVLVLIVGTLALTINRAISRIMANRRQGPSRVILVGGPNAVAKTLGHIEAEPDTVVVGVVDRIEDLVDKILATDPTDVLLLELWAFESAFPDPLTTIDKLHVGVHQQVNAQETLLGLKAVREVAGIPFTRMRTHAIAPHQLRLKRFLDLVMVIATAPITLPVMALLGAWVRLRAGRSVLYRQQRVGQSDCEFTLVKFRTMVHEAESDGPQLAKENDDRVIRGLRWMRTTRADELPQLWNVLKGEMSLVGPRPERPELINHIERDVAGYARRHEVPPGITGLAQIYGRYSTDPGFKLGYDLQYLVNWSLILDIQILFRTVWVVIRRRV